MQLAGPVQARVLDLDVYNNRSNQCHDTNGRTISDQGCRVGGEGERLLLAVWAESGAEYLARAWSYLGLDRIDPATLPHDSPTTSRLQWMA